MNVKIFPAILLSTLLMPVASATARPAKVEIGGKELSLRWQRSKEGWSLVSVDAFGLKGEPARSQHTVIFSADSISTAPVDPSDIAGAEPGFPEKDYRYVIPSWKEATSAVALNRAGDAFGYLPDRVEKVSANEARLSYDNDIFSVTETWRVDGSEISIDISLSARRDGWYSIASPSVVAIDRNDLDFAIIPGVLHGSELNPDFSRAYAYGWGIPQLPVIFRERSVSTLSSIATSRNGLSIAVTAEPGTALEPWGTDARNVGRWRLGLSAMNRSGELSPTLYHPVAGGDDSFVKAGEKRDFSLRVSFGKDGWWPLFRHAAEDIYRFGESLSLRRNRRSLTDRLYSIHRYVVNDSTSRWHSVPCEGDTIGAQEYLGGVYMAKKDALKNADYGAMWMLGAITGDSLITSKRLPYALNFKTHQIHREPGFLKGSSRGQYYLSEGKRFVEEWGPYAEPIATTYYLLMDLGNISLFEPENRELKQLIGEAADWLLSTQKEDGSWAVAYRDDDGHEEVFTDLKDYRPTFYGLLIAYRTTGEKKYLEAARKGADWLIENAVKQNKWLGVCGDTRFAPDFATAQAAQAFLDLYDICADPRYLDAALTTARFYTTSVYTNPIASHRPVKVKGKELEQWQITTSGLSYEHGGIIGSTNLHGPILLASHAGMFVRMYRLTGEPLFLEMARAAAIGRDAFVDDPTGVASYYWAAMNRGAGPYPHHAWWQMGWITDYLLAELELRSDGKISFPAGFITPKVGPHRTFGFLPGTVFGEKASLRMIPGEFATDNPDIEIVLAENDDLLFVMLLNDVDAPQKFTLKSKHHGDRQIEIAPYGLETIRIKK